MQFPSYPFTGCYHKVGDFRLHYLDEGSHHSEAIVMLHGNPSWSYYYRLLVLALRDHYRCIVPDHIGMGLSDKPNCISYPFTLEQRVNDLGVLLDQLQIRKNITLVLHDWGGMIGMAYARLHPQRIKRLIILNSWAFCLPKTRALPWQLRLALLPGLGKLLNQGLNIFCYGAVKQCVTNKPMPKAVARAYLAPYNSWAHRLAIHLFVKDIPLDPSKSTYHIVQEVDASLEQFSRLPMLICWGLQDFVFDRHFLAEWQRRFPNAQCHHFASAGHYVLEDVPEQIIFLIKNFLSRHPLRRSL